MTRLDRSSIRTQEGIPYFSDPTLKRFEWLNHAFLTRQGGMSLSPYHSLNVSLENGDDQRAVLGNRDRIAYAFGFDPARLVLCQQIHQDGIFVLNDPALLSTNPMKFDAVITHLPDLYLGILTADCLPIFIVDPKRRVIAAIHAGRQGSGLKITQKVLRTMKAQWRCAEEDLLVVLGPSIGPCCYEVDDPVFSRQWEPFSISKRAGRWMVDLAGINIAQMTEEGVGEHQISRIDLCTRCHNDLFFSYRGEGVTGRQLSFIGMKGGSSSKSLG
ncbi:MAG: peptidoglycan editing factor PgeF [Desulfobacterota bacterium]|nr:peptidoglycan editing factor PgeF [Thermodesulfobacteriota bacterium]